MDLTATVLPSGGNWPVSPEQRRDVQQALTALPPWLSARQRLRATCHELSRVLGVPVGLASFAPARGWTLLGESPDSPSSLARRLERAPRPDPRSNETAAWRDLGGSHADGRQLTIVPLPGASPESSPYAILDGDWSSVAPEARAFVEDVVAVRRPAPGTESYNPEQFARDLSVAGDTADALDTLLTAARAVAPSRYASVAMPMSDGTLRVVAASGYPVSITALARIVPGQGLLGEVCRRGLPFVATDVGTSGLTPRRPRFRTGACVLVPIAGGGRVLAVLALADPDRDVYTREAVEQVLTLLPPMTLALLRLRSDQQAVELSRAAAIDQSTGLANRAHFEGRLREEVQRSARHGTALSVQIVDVDSFKTVNDQFGHGVGDDVVRGVAEILKRSVRVFDVCARFGGDEFAILMPGSRLDSATVIADRIRSRIAARHAPLPPAPTVTVSIGVAELSEGEGAAAFVERADRALYKAKREGKNRVIGG